MSARVFRKTCPYTIRAFAYPFDAHKMAAIIVHGGAYSISEDMVPMKKKGCQLAAETGYKILESETGSALDAVEAAVRVLEDDPFFNAGHGSIINIAGEVEMDAMIMDGSSLNLGSVFCVKNIANPVTLARRVMEKTDHVILSGEGANLFARQEGFPEVSTEELLSIDVKKRWNYFSRYVTVVQEIFAANKKEDSPVSDIPVLVPPPTKKDDSVPKEHDTVGAVARDRHGNIACATSTGGITKKMVGRVGDSPLIGCGGYADNELGGISTTGHGESIARATLATRVLHLTKVMPTQKAIDEGLSFMKKKIGGTGGLILITPSGEIAKGFTTRRMAWASIDANREMKTGMDP